MTTLTLTDPVNGTVADANTIASNNAAIKTVVNGNVDNANVATSAAIAVTKLAAGGSGQVLGMLAGVPTWLGGMAKISDTTLGGTTANFDLTSIPGTYASLEIWIYARGDTAAISTGLNMRMNNDSAANYDWEQAQSSATTPTANQGNGTTELNVGDITASTGPANVFGFSKISIPYYAGTSNNKVCFTQSSMKRGTGGGTIFVTTTSGFWRSSTAITRLTLLPAAGSFVTDSRCILYGIG